MWYMQLCTAHLLAVSDFRYLQISASGGSKSSFLPQKWSYSQRSLLSFKDIKNRKPPKDAPCAAAYFMYQTLNHRMNIRGLNWGNRFVQTRTEPARSGFSWNHYNRNGPKTEPLLTLGGATGNCFHNLIKWATVISVVHDIFISG